jgi:hypothetical protein
MEEKKNERIVCLRKGEVPFSQKVRSRVIKVACKGALDIPVKNVFNSIMAAYSGSAKLTGQ